MKKHYIILSAAAALAAASPMLNAQTASSKPVGVRSFEFSQGFNLFSPVLQSQVISAGVITAISSDGFTITAGTTNFSTVLTAGKSYVLYLLDSTNANNNGVNAPINTSASTSNLVVTQSVFANVVANTTKYEIREIPTISDYFGANNDKGLLGGASGGVADVIWIVNSSGVLERHFYNTTANVWRRFGSPTGNTGLTNIYPTDALYVEKRNSGTTTVTFTGHVRNYNVRGVLETGFNYIANSVPVNTTLATSQLQTSITGGAQATADVVWVANGTAGYNRYYYDSSLTPPRWRTLGSPATTDRGTVELPSAFLIERKGSMTNYTSIVPSTLDI
jgi:hypothetical protein